MFGLKVNFHKSVVSGVGMKKDETNKFCIFLEMPLGASPRLKKTWRRSLSQLAGRSYKWRFIFSYSLKNKRDFAMKIHRDFSLFFFAVNEYIQEQESQQQGKKRWFHRLIPLKIVSSYRHGFNGIRMRISVFWNPTHLNDYLQHWYWHSSPSLVKITNNIDLHWMIIFDRFRTSSIRHDVHWHRHDRATWYWDQTLVWQLQNTRTKSEWLSTILRPVVFWWQRRASFIHMRVRIHRIVSR